MHHKLNVVLCWHMHQPWYRDGLAGEYRLPWVYLHAIKDYSDMALHLERHPPMRAVVNFAPVLLEQLVDYAEQIHQWLQVGTPMLDNMLNLLAGVAPIPNSLAARHQLLEDCRRCNAARMIAPLPAFQHLLDMVQATEVDGVKHHSQAAVLYLNDQYFVDLLVWYHLTWLGQSLRQQPAIKALFAKGEGYTLTERRHLLEVIQQCVAGLIPRYRALADRGQVELSMTPYMHPIVPLLQDFGNMRCALPDAPAPESPTYPGGQDRARWHMQQGIAIFQTHFGRKPQGVWLSEGGVSESALALLDEFGIRWTASGEGVWRNSCQLSGYQGDDFYTKRALFMPYCLPQQEVRLFFRDDGLSDMIGFKYSHWDARDAVRDFVQHLENIAQFLGAQANQQVVSIILDGENAWEYYPDNASDFLDLLYAKLSHHKRLNITRFADVCNTIPAKALPRLCAGSWVYGSFSTWIGSADKNRGWDYLVAAKHAYDQVMRSGTLAVAQQQEATRQLAVCEGSDWFWWFGDYNPSDSVRDFERLYRQQLGRLYTLLSLEKPAYLALPLSQGGGQGAENGGMMRSNT